MDPETHRETFGYEPIGEDLGAPTTEEEADQLVSVATFLVIAAISFVAFMIVSSWLGA